jgi:ubiquinone/menaquinone biosynthesis C-methylase UbiE
MATEHDQLVVDQFTRQAASFASSPAIRDRILLDLIVDLAGAGPDDTSLDVACGPGLLVCAFAERVAHATGIDLTSAMLAEARAEQSRRRLSNLSWHIGDATRLPYDAATFSIVSSRFAFHHMPDPRPALREMVRVLRPGGRIVVADSAPAPQKAERFNRVERLRDPSHVRALTVDELRTLFEAAGLPEPRVRSYRLEGVLSGLLARSFPNPGDERLVEEMFRASLADDALDLATAERNGEIYYGFPVAILASRR